YRAGVLPTMRILYRGDTYDIKGPALPDPDSGLEYLTILVAKGVRDDPCRCIGAQYHGAFATGH
ncbi:head-tail adaptor protein, partial [Pseudomonas syringae]|uniref:head-tail adaptor protein n=1 Tax=Pseudomonas syringae TaxID=317 RepID=UPI0021C380DF